MGPVPRGALRGHKPTAAALRAPRDVNQETTSAACLAGETAAILVQQQFLVWLTRTLEPHGLPSVAVVGARLSAEQANLARKRYSPTGASRVHVLRAAIMTRAKSTTARPASDRL